MNTHMHMLYRTIRIREIEFEAILLRLSKALPWAGDITSKSLNTHLSQIFDNVPMLLALEGLDLPKLIGSSEKTEVKRLSSGTRSSRRSESKALVLSSTSSVVVRTMTLPRVVLAPPSYRKSLDERTRKLKKLQAIIRRMQSSVTKQNGADDDDDDDTVIDSEYLRYQRLLLQGFSCQQIISGNINEVGYVNAEDIMNDQTLTEKDLPDDELDTYILSEAEVRVYVRTLCCVLFLCILVFSFQVLQSTTVTSHNVINIHNIIHIRIPSQCTHIYALYMYCFVCVV